MKSEDVTWSKELKEAMLHIMTSTESIKHLVHYLVEYIAREDDTLPECDGEDEHEIDAYNKALVKVLRKSKHFKDVWKFLKVASDYYCHDYNNDLMKHFATYYDLEVTA